MKVDILINEGTCLILSPDNEMEAEILKNLAKQTNDVIEIRGGAALLNKQLSPNSIIICKHGTIGSNGDKLDKGKPDGKEKDSNP